MSYSKTFGEQTIEFNRPTVDQIDRYLRMGQKGISKASIQLAADTVKPEHKEAWSQMVQDKPGRAVQAATIMLEDLGYSGDDSD